MNEIFVRLLVGVIATSIMAIMIFLISVIALGSVKETFESFSFELVVAWFIVSTLIIAIFSEKE